MYALIPLLPLSAFLTIGLFGRWLRERSHLVAIPAVSLSFALSGVAFLDVLLRGPIRLPLYTFIHAGSLHIELGLYIDTLTAVLLLLVAGVSDLVHRFSVRYMQGDPRYARYFAVIALFTGAMLLLVLSSNLLILYLCWELMALCSYLLISHWAERKAACLAATRAFLVNAVADVGLGLGVLLTFTTFGTLEIPEILAKVQDHVGETITPLGWLGLDWAVAVTTLIPLLFFIGAMGKSAQVPFHVWLPFAMEAPTPVSALIHAATMVNAGVYLVLRLSPLYTLAPFAMTLVAVVGATTALGAAIVALTQSDIKRILAYSTISQLGFMMLACGVGAYVAAIFHLVAHGALKGFLFLYAGNVLNPLALQQDFHLRERHSRAAPHPARPWLLYPVALALACLPPLVIVMSRYDRLWMAAEFGSAEVAFLAILAAATGLTALALFRWVLAILPHPTPVEWGDRVSSSPPGLLGGVAVTGMIALAWAGLLALLWRGFVEALSPVLAPSPLTTPEVSGPLLLSLLTAAIGGFALAMYTHFRPFHPSPRLAGRLKPLYVLVLNKGYFDEVYDTAIIRPTLALARWLERVVERQGFDWLLHGFAMRSVVAARWLWQHMDLRGIDRLGEGMARLTVKLAHWLWHEVDLRGIDRLVEGMARLTVKLAHWLWHEMDLRRLDRPIEQVGRVTEVSAEHLRQMEPRLLPHLLGVVILLLVLAMSILIWFGSQNGGL